MPCGSKCANRTRVRRPKEATAEAPGGFHTRSGSDRRPSDSLPQPGMRRVRIHCAVCQEVSRWPHRVGSMLIRHWAPQNFSSPARRSRFKWSSYPRSELHGEMAEVVNRIPRVHKLPHYLPIYEAAVDRTRPIRMLEIGNFYGDSSDVAGIPSPRLAHRRY
jgi:hypothetical protein